MDKISLPGVDIVHDLNTFPYPFADSSFDEIYAMHVIEHLDSIVRAMEEIHRLAKPNAKVVIVTPHYSDCSSWNDPTHKWHLSTYSFRYFREGYQESYYSKARFETEGIHMDMARLWRALGFEGILLEDFLNASGAITLLVVQKAQEEKRLSLISCALCAFCG